MGNFITPRLRPRMAIRRPGDLIVPRRDRFIPFPDSVGLVEVPAVTGTVGINGIIAGWNGILFQSLFDLVDGDVGDQWAIRWTGEIRDGNNVMMNNDADIAAAIQLRFGAVPQDVRFNNDNTSDLEVAQPVAFETARHDFLFTGEIIAPGNQSIVNMRIDGALAVGNRILEDGNNQPARFMGGNTGTVAIGAVYYLGIALPDGTVLHYDFDEGTGLVINERSAGGPIGDITGVEDTRWEWVTLA